MNKIAEKIKGSWRLSTSELFDEAGKSVFDPLAGSTGIIVYTDESMSVQVMPKDYPIKPNGEPTDVYHAYFGGYSVDEDAGMVTHYVKGSTHADMIDRSFSRKVNFWDDDKKMSLCTDPAEDVFGDGRLLYHKAAWGKIK